MPSSEQIKKNVYARINKCLPASRFKDDKNSIYMQMNMWWLQKMTTATSIDNDEDKQRYSQLVDKQYTC